MDNSKISDEISFRFTVASFKWRVSQVAGISLKMLQQKVAYLSYKLKRYIDVAGLYRDTSPVKLEEDGILISRAHLVETPYKDGERFKIDFKDK
jgi:hypothetical protein